MSKDKENNEEVAADFYDMLNREVNVIDFVRLMQIFTDANIVSHLNPDMDDFLDHLMDPDDEDIDVKDIPDPDIRYNVSGILLNSVMRKLSDYPIVDVNLIRKNLEIHCRDNKDIMIDALIISASSMLNVILGSGHPYTEVFLRILSDMKTNMEYIEESFHDAPDKSVLN